eukprot:TRINITY_DN53727_c0_g1_i1.p1 TRINITY_DN53727_c0_g1~~TRINITY_DN53727_c0_g1_i1.p1  ORF type:complete len:242 (+),score=34.76 TRINITY_DN53727_c0_g1_i1:67-792(+)
MEAVESSSPAAGMDLNLAICDADSGFVEAASRYFQRFAGVTVVCRRLEEYVAEELAATDVQLEHSCVVWPGNSAAVPAGGLAMAMEGWLGSSVLVQAQQDILMRYDEDGAPTGTAFLYDLHELRSSPVGRPRYVVFVAAFPRRPRGPHLCMQAVLQAVAEHNSSCAGSANEERGSGKLAAPCGIRTLVCPGLGTFEGMPDLDAAAGMMADAYASVGGLQPSTATPSALPAARASASSGGSS